MDQRKIMEKIGNVSEKFVNFAHFRLFPGHINEYILSAGTSNKFTYTSKYPKLDVLSFYTPLGGKMDEIWDQKSPILRLKLQKSLNNLPERYVCPRIW